MDESRTEMEDNVTKLEQERNKPVPDVASFVNVERLTNPTTNVLQTPLSSERLEKLEDAASEDKHKFKLLQLKTTHPDVEICKTCLILNVISNLYALI